MKHLKTSRSPYSVPYTKLIIILQDICKALWCYRGNKRCETKFLPAAEGTSCGAGKVSLYLVMPIVISVPNMIY